MSSQLRISADTSEVKKSILDIGKSIKDLKGSKVSVFTAEDKKFIKSEMKKEIALMKTKLKENRDEIKKMVQTQKEMVQGSKEELEMRKKILEAYKTQAKLAKDLGQTQKMSKSGGGIDQAGGGGLLGGLMNFARMIPGLAAVATIGYGLSKGIQANDQYVQGAGNRNRLKGLGVFDENFGSPEALARVGLTEQDMIQRRAEATAILGREGTSNEAEMRKAGFERAFGLQEGTMTGIAAQLRGSMGGAGANEAQLKLQASVFAAGIEDALGPYLESATQLLSSINESGMSNTDEMINLLAQLTKDGQRTPEMLSRAFAGIDNAVKGATGDQSAFLQTAFARAGIGGGSIGGTKFAMESGGIMGLDKAQLAKRGYNPQLLKQMEEQGMFSGVGQRTGAIMQMMQQAGGLKPGESISGIQDTDRMYSMNNLANSIFGTKGNQGFDALMMLEKVQNKEMTKKQFEDKLKQMKEGDDPSLSRLDKINNTLSGQTEILRTINTNLMENLGKEAVQGGNVLVSADNQGIQGVKNVAGVINDSGATAAAQRGVNSTGNFINGGKIGEWAYDKYDKWFGKSQDEKLQEATSTQSMIEFAKKRRDQGKGFKGWSDDQIEEKFKKMESERVTAKEIGKEVAKAMREAPISTNINNRIQLPDGKVVDKTGGK